MRKEKRHYVGGRSRERETLLKLEGKIGEILIFRY